MKCKIFIIIFIENLTSWNTIHTISIHNAFSYIWKMLLKNNTAIQKKMFLSTQGY